MIFGRDFARAKPQQALSFIRVTGQALNFYAPKKEDVTCARDTPNEPNQRAAYLLGLHWKGRESEMIDRARPTSLLCISSSAHISGMIIAAGH